MAEANAFRFSTKYQDDETDMLYYGYRYLNTGTGRWLARDPIGDESFTARLRPRLHEREELNLYHYALNAPLNLIDPFGLEIFPGGVPPPASQGCGRKSCTQEAMDADKKNFPGNPNPYDGAYRHCVAACCLAERYGQAIASALVDLWDLTSENPKKTPDSTTDMVGEQMGLAWGRNPPGGCASACLLTYPSPQIFDHGKGGNFPPPGGILPQ